MFYRNSCSDDAGQLDDGAVRWPVAQSCCTSSQLCARHWPAEWFDVLESSVKEEWDHGCTWYARSNCYLITSLSTNPYITDVNVLLSILMVGGVAQWQERRSLLVNFPVARSTFSWWVTTYVGKPSAGGQPTRSTRPFILSGSVNE